MMEQTQAALRLSRWWRRMAASSPALLVRRFARTGLTLAAMPSASLDAQVLPVVRAPHTVQTAAHMLVALWRMHANEATDKDARPLDPRTFLSAYVLLCERTGAAAPNADAAEANADAEDDTPVAEAEKLVGSFEAVCGEVRRGVRASEEEWSNFVGACAAFGTAFSKWREGSQKEDAVRALLFQCLQAEMMIRVIRSQPTPQVDHSALDQLVHRRNVFREQLVTILGAEEATRQIEQSMTHAFSPATSPATSPRRRRSSHGSRRSSTEGAPASPAPQTPTKTPTSKTELPSDPKPPRTTPTTTSTTTTTPTSATVPVVSAEKVVAATSPASASASAGQSAPAPAPAPAVVRSMFRDDPNARLVHEMLMNPDFDAHKQQQTVQPEFASKVQETIERAFWDSVLYDLRRDPPNYTRVVALTVELRDMLGSLTPNRKDKIAELKARVDPELLTQQIAEAAAGTAVIMENITYLAHCVKELQSEADAPKTEQWLQELTAEVGSMQAAEWPALVVRAFRFLFDQVQEVKKQIAQYRLEMAKPTILRNGAEYERKKFEEWLDKDVVTMERATAWLQRVVDRERGRGFPFLGGGSTGSSTGSSTTENHAATHQLATHEHARMTLYHLAVIALATQHTALTVHTAPETLLNDVQRVVGLQNTVQQTVLVATLAMVTRMKGAQYGGVMTDARCREFKDRLVAVLNDNHARLPDVAIEAVTAVESARKAANHDAELTAEQKESITTLINEATSTSHRIYSLLHGRLVVLLEQIVTVLSNIKELPRTKVSSIAALNVPDAHRQRLIQSLVNSGLQPMEPEVVDLAVALAVFARRHLAIYLPFYTPVATKLN